ncbi:MAG: molybdopterin containing oxidoreductase, partial [Limisphaerales bacterium]
MIGMVNGDWINQASQFRSMVPSRRRRFLAQLGLALGAPVVFADLLSQSGVFPRALAQSALEKGWPGKEELRLLSDRPLNAEAYATLLDDPITPNHRHFVRNNGLIPDRAKEGNLSDWSLRVDGEVQQVLDLDMAALKGSFKHVSAALVI